MYPSWPPSEQDPPPILQAGRVIYKGDDRYGQQLYQDTGATLGGTGSVSTSYVRQPDDRAAYVMGQNYSVQFPAFSSNNFTHLPVGFSPHTALQTSSHNASKQSNEYLSGDAMKQQTNDSQCSVPEVTTTAALSTLSRDPPFIDGVNRMKGRNGLTPSNILGTLSFESLRPTETRTTTTRSMSSEAPSSKLKILNILYPSTATEIEAGGHIGFAKARIELSMRRPCSCAIIERPILWVLTPDASIDGRCSFKERHWIRIEPNILDEEIQCNDSAGHFATLTYDLDKARRNTHEFFQDIKVRVKVRARTRGRDDHEPAEIDSFHTPIAAAFVYVHTWQHLSCSSRVTVSEYFSVGVVNARTHLSTATELGRKRRRTESAERTYGRFDDALIPPTAIVTDIEVNENAQASATASTSSPRAMSRLDIGETSEPSLTGREQSPRSLRDFVLFLAGREGGRPGLTDPTLIAESDREDQLRLHSISLKNGPAVLTLSGAKSHVWLQFICDFAMFVPLMMQYEDLDSLRVTHRISVMQQLYFLHRVLRDPLASGTIEREYVLIKSWMNVLGMLRSHCDPDHETRFDCLLILNQEVLNEIMRSEDDNFMTMIGSPADPSDIQYLAGLVYSECLRAWKPIIGMASRAAKPWQQRWNDSQVNSG